MKFTPFLYCCALNSVECANILIKHPQIDPNIPTDNLENHIELVLQNTNEEMLDLLLENEKIKLIPIEPFFFNSYLEPRADFNEKNVPYYKKLLDNVDRLRVSSIFGIINFLIPFYQKSNHLP